MICLHAQGLLSVVVILKRHYNFDWATFLKKSQLPIADSWCDKNASRSSEFIPNSPELAACVCPLVAEANHSKSSETFEPNAMVETLVANFLTFKQQKKQLSPEMKSMHLHTGKPTETVALSSHENVIICR